jgi:hypothetical protein
MRRDIRLMMVLLIGLMGWTSPAFSQITSNHELRRLMNNVHQDMTSCIAYFKIVEQCLAQNPKFSETAVGYRKAANDLLGKSSLLGKEVGLSDDAMQSRLKLAASDMMQLLQNDCVNISSLLERHSDRCTALALDPLKPLTDALPK